MSLLEKQISSLHQRIPYIRENQKNRLYTVPLRLTKHPNVFFRITLESSFPQTAPIIQLQPNDFVHPLVGDNNFLVPSSHHHLQHWTIHCDLGQLVYDLVLEFQKNEPYELAYNKPRPQVQQQQGRPEASFPELDRLSVDELKTLLNDDSKAIEFLEKIEAITTSIGLQKDLAKSNEELKEKKTALMEELNSIETAINDERHKLEQINSSYNQIARLKESMVNKLSPQALATALNTKSQVLYEQSEDFADNFVQGQVALDQFLDQFFKQRKDYHLCVIKEKSYTNQQQRYTTPFQGGTWRPDNTF